MGVVYLVWSKNSCGFTFVVFEEASKPFVTLNWASMLCVLADSRKEQGIPFPLMISLVMIMRQVFIEGTTQRRFSKQKQPREALLLDYSDPRTHSNSVTGVAGPHVRPQHHR